MTIYTPGSLKYTEIVKIVFNAISLVFQAAFFSDTSAIFLDLFGQWIILDAGCAKAISCQRSAERQMRSPIA